MPRTVADAARMIRIQRLSCTSGHWYRRRVSRYITSVAIAPAKRSQAVGQDGAGARRVYPRPEPRNSMLFTRLCSRRNMYGSEMRWRRGKISLGRRCFDVLSGFVNWAATQAGRASNRKVQDNLLAPILRCRDSSAAPSAGQHSCRSSFVDFKSLDQSYSATKLGSLRQTAVVRRAGAGIQFRANSWRMKGCGQ